MNIENRAILQGPVPKSLVETIKIGERVLATSTGSELSLGTGIVFATAGKIEDVQKNEFIKNNLIGREAVERGIDLGIVFQPSLAGGISTDEFGRDTLYLSADFFKPVYALNSEDARQRKDVSNGCVFAFYMIADMITSKLPEEVPFPSSADLVEHVSGSLPKHLREQNVKGDTKIETFAQDIENLIIKNSSRVAFTVQGLRINVNLDGVRVFSLLSGQDEAVRSIILDPIVDSFIKVMRQRHIWFSSDEDLQCGVPLQSDQMKSVVSLLKGQDKIKTYGDIYREYCSSSLGMLIGEEIVNTLLISKHSGEESESGGSIIEQDFEEIEDPDGYELLKGRPLDVRGWRMQAPHKSGRKSLKRESRKFETDN